MFATNRPFEQMNRLRDELDRIFSGVETQSVKYPPLNVWEDDQQFYVEAELPGMKLEDLEITIEDGKLSIRGSRQQASPPGEAEGAWHRRERWHGTFDRSFSIGKDVDIEQVSAEFKHGILTVKLPKSEAARPKRVKVEVSH